MTMNAPCLTIDTSQFGKSVRTLSRILAAAALAVVLMVSGLAVAGKAHAQQPFGPPSPPLPFPGNLAGTSWSGQENLTGSWTKLRFDFLQNGQVRMTDSQMSYYGTYSQGTGGQVTIQLPGIATTFNGVATSQAITGKGYDGKGPPWDFSVQRSN
jgi:hypothetical protein